MIRRLCLVSGFVLLMGFETVCAEETALQRLVQEEQHLSAQIKEAYLGGRDTSEYFRRLLAVQKEIRTRTKNSEVNDMVRFLDYCMEDLKTALKAPKNKPNEEIVSDLDGSIQEGCCYIGRLSGKKPTQ